MIVSIDPGPIHSGVIHFDPDAWQVLEAKLWDNPELLEYLRAENIPEMPIEVMQAMGMAISQDTMDTQLWAGRFIEAVDSNGGKVTPLFRREIKLHLCGDNRAKDSNVSAAVKSRFEPTGGGKDPYKGIKGQPGPLYMVSGGDVWSALAVMMTYCETKRGMNE